MKVLSQRAPHRHWYFTGEGWASRAYNLLDVVSALSSGAQFHRGQHDFEDPRAAALAIRPELRSLFF